MVIHLQASRAVHRLQLQGRQLVPPCGYSQALLVLQVQGTAHNQAESFNPWFGNHDSMILS